AGGVTHLLLRYLAHRNGCKWDEKQTERDALNELRPEEVPIASVQIELCELMQRESAAYYADHQHPPRIESRQQNPDQRHRNHRAHTARRQGDARAERRIA